MVVLAKCKVSALDKPYILLATKKVSWEQYPQTVPIIKTGHSYISHTALSFGASQKQTRTQSISTPTSFMQLS